MADERAPVILDGALSPLPSDHIWMEGPGCSLYLAEQPPSSWSEHSHLCAQITIAFEGAGMEAFWRSNSGTSGQRVLHGPSVSVVPAEDPHRTTWRRKADLLHLYLDLDLLQQTADTVCKGGRAEIATRFLQRDPLLEQIGEAIRTELRAGTANDLLLSSAAHMVSLRLLRAYQADLKEMRLIRGGLEPTKLRHLRDFIEANLSANLSIGALAQLTGLSTAHFAEAFRVSTGATPHRYVTERRVEHAKQMLREGRLPLAEISSLTGFSSQSQFTTVFGRVVGLSPLQYRRAQRR
jgi:AraC family transcriptional regulator